jgi:hypothetical protein
MPRRDGGQIQPMERLKRPPTDTVTLFVVPPTNVHTLSIVWLHADARADPDMMRVDWLPPTVTNAAPQRTKPLQMSGRANAGDLKAGDDRAHRPNKRLNNRSWRLSENKAVRIPSRSIHRR